MAAKKEGLRASGRTKSSRGISRKDFYIGSLFVEHTYPSRIRYSWPLVFINGAFHGSWQWVHYLDYFARQGWECFAPSLRGHYRNRLEEAEFASTSLLDYVGDIQEVTSHLDEPVVIVGHSVGGLLVQKYAELRDTMAMVLLAPGPPSGLVGAPVRRPLPLGRPFGPPPADVLRRDFFHSISDKAFEALYPLFGPESPVALNERYQNLLSVDRAKVSSPVLVMCAEFDRPEVHGGGVDRRTAEYYGADYYFIRGRGHDFFLEEGWEQEAKRIQDWLDQHPGRDAKF